MSAPRRVLPGYSLGSRIRVVPNSTIVSPAQIVSSTADAPKYESAIRQSAVVIKAVGAFGDMTALSNPSPALIESLA
jgi:hypothetical protein